MPTPNASVVVKIGAAMDATVSSAFGKTTAGLKRIGDTMKILASRSQELKRLDSTSQHLGESVQTLTERYAKQNAILAKAESRFAQVKEKITSAGAADEKRTAQMDAADAAVIRARTNLDCTNASLTKTKSDFAEASAAAERFRAANQHVEASLGRLGAAMKRYEAANAAVQTNEAKRAEYRSKIVGVLAAGLFIKKSIEKAAEGEDASLRFKWSLEGNSTQQQIGALMAKTRATAMHSLASAPELLKIQTVLHKEDIGAEDALIASETIHKVASVTQQDAEETARAIGSIFHTVSLGMTGSTGEKLARLGDIVATMQQRFAISDVSGLAAGLTKALPQATMARVSFEQTAAAIGALTRHGLDAAGAGQQIGAVLRNLTKASQALGFQLVRNAKGNLDFEATIRSMNKRLIEMGGLARNRDALTQAFTRRGADAAFFLSQAAAAGELNKAQAEMADSAGSVAREYRELSDSAKGMILKIGKALDQTLRPIGRALLPGVKAVLEPIGKLMEVFGGFLDKHPTIARWIGGIAAALIGATVAVYALGWAGAVLSGGLAKVKLAIEWANLRLVAHAERAGAAAVAEGALATAEGEEAIAASTANAATVTRIGLLAKLKIALLGVGDVLAASPLLGGLVVGGLGALTGGAIAYHQQQEFQAATDERYKRWSGTHLVLNQATPSPGAALEAARLPGGHALPDTQSAPLRTPLSGQIQIVTPKKMSEGGIATRPAHVIVGDAGEEAIVPLPRGFRQGLGNSTNTIQAPVTIHIHGNVDPRAVATQVRTELERAVRDAEARRRGGMHD